MSSSWQYQLAGTLGMSHGLIWSGLVQPAHYYHKTASALGMLSGEGKFQD